MEMQLLVFVGLLLATCTQADDLFGGRRRDLLQFCHPQRSTAIGNKAIGAFYTHPEVGGMKVDYCLGLNRGCGKRAADKFCKLKGMKFAESYILWSRAGLACGGTRAIESKEICTGECTGFRVISCAGTLVPDILDSFLGSEEDSAPVESISQETPKLSQPAVKEPQEVPESKPVDPDVAPPHKTAKETVEETGKGSSEESGEESPNANKDELPATPSEQDAPDPEAHIDPTTKPADSTEGSEDGSATPAKAEPKEEKPKSASETEPSTGRTESPQNSGDGANAQDHEIQIDHPDLGDVVLPGQQQPAKDERSPAGNSETQDKPSSNQGSAQQKDSVFCQERGSQSSSAAARNGCGSVISVCASNEAIADAQNASRNAQRDSVRGTTGRRLTQQVVDTEECKTLFANECQAAAFDNAHGLCTVLMGSGPSLGQEKEGCKSAEQARDIFKESVQKSCDKFMAGAFP